MNRLRLGVNIDHVATIRNARGGVHPDPAEAARLAQQAGADGITFHLREDRRHICDDDLLRICGAVSIPVNMEMAPVEEMVDIALEHRPETVTMVPEKRQERTTEGGLDVSANKEMLAQHIARLRSSGIRTSLFIEPEEDQVRAAAHLGVRVCEFHTGRYVEEHCREDADAAMAECTRIARAAALADDIGLIAHAGHGLTYDSVGAIAGIRQIRELNIGHFLIGEAVFSGLGASIARMRMILDQVRRQ